jgi:peptidoglycan/xylan/chitin deacetylase (PgdA/CDA1 family)
VSTIARLIGDVTRSSFSKVVLYRGGALAAYHRLRNRRALTVVMFHRVLSPRDRRWSYCDPEYTVSDELFGACLDFFARNYRVIALEELLAPRPSLPDWPLLITFDDGWRDNAQYALPLLEQAGMPATIFVTSDAIDASDLRPFWPEQLIHAFRRRRLDAERCQELWLAAGGDPAVAPPFTALEHVRALVAALVALERDRLERVLAPLRPLLAASADERELLSAAELRGMAAHGFAIGAHGQTHWPLARVHAPAAELVESRRVLGEKLGGKEPLTMAFPHGSYTASVVAHARAAGYRHVFTSDPVLNRVDKGGSWPMVLGRTYFQAADITDHAGRFRPERLAMRLFRAPHATLAGGDAAPPARREVARGRAATGSGG